MLPSVKTLVDSVADGVVDVAEAPVRVATNIAGVAQGFASEVKANMDNVKSQMPDNPGVIPEAAIKAAGQTAKAGLGMIQGLGKGIMDTLDAVKSQVQRVL